MASLNRGDRKSVKTSEGLELNLSAYRLHESLGIETTPGEIQSTSAPQTRANPEKECADGEPTTAQFQHFKIPSGNRSVRKSKRFLPFLVALIIIVVVVLALAIPLALQLRKPSKQPSRINSNSTTGVPDGPSTSGALNGTDLAIIALDQIGVPDISLFYQDHNLQFRRLRSLELSPFIDGLPIVASNARNATPLTSLTYPTSTGEINSHLYYVDTNNALQELYSSDNCTTWQPGFLGDINFTASVSSTALTAFYSDHWLSQDGNSTGIRLYYGAPDNQVHELALFPNSTHNPSQYYPQSVFRGTNGNAGIASAWTENSGLANLISLTRTTSFKYGLTTSTSLITRL